MKAIAIIGVGLIGGSVALALKANPAMRGLRIVGVDRDAFNLDWARKMQMIDATAKLESLGAVDAVLLAVPVRQMREVFAVLAPQLSPDTWITDAGSVKNEVIAAARETLGAKIAQFVPAHPIAGRELSGPQAAQAELCKGKKVVLTPLAENAPATIAAARALWQSCGAEVAEMSPETHDAVFAAVSHLPHMLAFALVDELASRPNAKTLFSFAAAGFRDFTRIAGSDPEMWRDIALANRKTLVEEFDRYLAHAHKLRDAIAAARPDEMEQTMERARRARERWMAGDLGEFRDEAS